MHGLGNDFIVIDGINQRINDEDIITNSVKLCDRNFGVGADGVILVSASEKCDLKMRIINADGSEPEMCGNGIRCYAKFVYEEKLIDKDVFSVETLAGNIIPAINISNGEVNRVEVDMGEPIFDAVEIPTSVQNQKTVLNYPVTIEDNDYFINCVSMGNPHAVIFVDDLTQINLSKLGPVIETHPLFPEKTNVHFVQVVSKTEAIVDVWERGAGETLACGTGACAVLAAGFKNGLLDRSANIKLPGGILKIDWQAADNHIIMTGPASLVFKGEIKI